MIKVFAAAGILALALTCGAPLAGANPPDPHPNMSCAAANDWSAAHNAKYADTSIPDDVYNGEAAAIRAQQAISCGS